MWLVYAVKKHSVEVSGMDGMALTKLDVLDSFKEIKICIGYKIKEKDRLFSLFRIYAGYD